MLAAKWDSIHGQNHQVYNVILLRSLFWPPTGPRDSKGRARWAGKGDPLAQLQFIDELFGLAI